jgi:hypothetical protein
MSSLKGGAMERREALKIELLLNGEQRRQMRRFAGAVRFITNKALALNKEGYEKAGSVNFIEAGLALSAC